MRDTLTGMPCPHPSESARPARSHTTRIHPLVIQRPATSAQPLAPRTRLVLCTLLGLMAAVTNQAGAAEHITLRNGFELTCDHRALTTNEPDAVPSVAVTVSRVRLYLDASETNYFDVTAEDILASETMAPSMPPVAPPPAPAQPKSSDLSPSELHQLLATAGTEHNLDVDLLASLVHAESASHTRAVSRSGAQGLMQLMPATAAELGVQDSFAPAANIHGGTAYLDSLLKRYHDNLALALAAYNAGPGAVDRFHGIPPYRETRAYVARIIHEFNQRYSARQAASLAMARQ